MTLSLSDSLSPITHRHKSSEPGSGQRLVIDLLSLSVAFGATYLALNSLREAFSVTEADAARSAVVVAAVVIWMTHALGMYRPTRAAPRRQVQRTIRSAFITMVAVGVGIAFAPVGADLRLFIATAVLGWVVLFVSARALLAQTHAGCRERLLIVATGDHGPDQTEVIRRLELAPENIEIVGVVDHHNYSSVLDAAADVDLVAMLPGVPDADRTGLSAAALVAGARLLLVPDPMESAALGGSPANWYGVDGRELDLYRHTTLQGRIKRLVDLLGASLGLMASVPILLCVAAVVRIDSPGPVLFRQTRIGLHGREFKIAKFRTMTVDAEASTGAVFAAANDSRITGVGKWLRLTRLDELPQLWNVIVGDMSLIGPRPERPEFVVGFAAQIAGYELRHGVRPGITGLAQVRAGYSATPEEKLRFDLEYVFGHTMGGDARIMVQTVATMLDLSAAEGTRASAPVAASGVAVDISETSATDNARR